MHKIILKILIWIHNFSYRLIGFFAIKENGGIHPKHGILNFYEFFIDNVSPTDTILDIGCGNGACTNAVAKKVSKAVGIDISESNIKMAKEKFSNENLEYIIGDATTYDFEENFDAIVLSNVLEHIEDRIEFLKKIKKIAPKILIRVPLLSRDWLSVYKKQLGAEYRLDKTHYIEYTQESFQKEMQEAGFSIENSFIKFGELFAAVKTNQ